MKKDAEQAKNPGTGATSETSQPALNERRDVTGRTGFQEPYPKPVFRNQDDGVTGRHTKTGGRRGGKTGV